MPPRPFSHWRLLWTQSHSFGSKRGGGGCCHKAESLAHKDVLKPGNGSPVALHLNSCDVLLVSWWSWREGFGDPKAGVVHQRRQRRDELCCITAAFVGLHARVIKSLIYRPHTTKSIGFSTTVDGQIQGDPSKHDRCEMSKQRTRTHTCTQSMKFNFPLWA